MTALAFTRLDFQAVRPYVRSMLTTLAIFGAMMVLVPLTGASVSPDGTVGLPLNVYAIVPYLVVMGAIVFTSYPFSTDERARLDTLYSVLPVKRQTVVIGRYLTICAVTLSLAVLSTVLLFGISLALRQPLDLRILLQLLLCAIAISSLFVAIQAPLYFSLGFTKARPLTLGILAAVVGVPLIILSSAGANLFDLLGRLLLSVRATSTIAVIGLLLLAASAWLSMLLYQRREL